MKRLAILGSTGSIGRSALAVVAAHPERVRVVALAAGENAAVLAEQVVRFAPAFVGVPRAQPSSHGRSRCDARAASPIATVDRCADPTVTGLASPGPSCPSLCPCPPPRPCWRPP